jgi:hypothetical protein
MVRTARLKPIQHRRLSLVRLCRRILKKALMLVLLCPQAMKRQMDQSSGLCQTGTDNRVMDLMDLMTDYRIIRYSFKPFDILNSKCVSLLVHVSVIVCFVKKPLSGLKKADRVC